VWPEWDINAAIGFVIARARCCSRPRSSAGAGGGQGARRFGGVPAVTLSVLVEIVFSALLAPIRMLFHTQFVLAALTGLGVPGRVRRGRTPRPVGEGLRRHGAPTLLGGAWAAPSTGWTLVRLVAAAAGGRRAHAVHPISAHSSGIWPLLRRARLLLIPEESDPPKELQAMRVQPPARRRGRLRRGGGESADQRDHVRRVGLPAPASPALRRAGTAPWPPRPRPTRGR